MTLTNESVLAALKAVRDPDLNQDIVSLGFVKNLRICDRNVAFDIELTTPACPVKDLLKKEAVDQVKALGAESVEVTMTAQVRQRPTASANKFLPGVKNTIAVASGKGGVGKSTVAVNLALALKASGAKVGLLDADIYGPSVPTMLGLEGRPESAGENMIHPLEKDGMKVMSMGFLATDDTPVIWRGPMVHGIITQFLGNVLWGELDYLVVDLPPGTGDAQLTLTQTAPLSGAVIVTTPQDVSMKIVRRGLRMFQKVNVPVLGIIENMSTFVCPNCKSEHAIFSKGGGEKIAKDLSLPFLGAIPIDPAVVAGGDKGVPILLSNPDSPASKAYQKIAGLVAAQLSIQAMKPGETQENLSFQWKTATH